VGLSEDDRLEAPIVESDPKPLPANWNASQGSYGFRYTHEQSSLQFLIKINRLGGKTVIMGLGVGDDKTTSFDFVTKDYLSESFFPYNPSTDPSSKRLQDAFISENRLADLATLFKINVVQKLTPGIVKPGYEEERVRGNDGPEQTREPPRRRPDDTDDPLRVPRPYGDPFAGGFPRPGPPPIPAGGERPPGFEDEYEVLQPPHGYGSDGRHPLSIGADDLNPPGLGPNPPLRGPFFGEGGGMPGPMGPMGGMHPTGDHPMFGGRGSGQFGDPRAPPGARYDPVGPGDEPRGGLRGPRGPGGGPPGAPFNPFSNFGSDDFI